MKKKLIVALILVILLLAGAVGVILYQENKPQGETVPGSETVDSAPGETAGTEISTDPAETTEPTEETIVISLPTENPEDVLPEETFSEEDEVPPVTGDPDATEGTEDRESNETPEDVFETGD